MAKKRIRTLNNNLNGISKNESFRICINLTEIKSLRLKAIGLSEVSINQSMLPRAIGSISRFNSRGKHMTHKDQPKERRYLGTREWTRNEWAGRGQTRKVTTEVDMYRDCYPQTFISPPSCEIKKVSTSESLFFISEELKYKSENDVYTIHIINLFLELFGDYAVFKNGKLSTIETEKINWKFLPPGEYPWRRIIEHIKTNNKKSKEFTKVIEERQKYIETLKPTKTYIGAGGFSDYIAYVFSQFTILESIAHGNALYVFYKDWEILSQQTKAQIIVGGEASRIIHASGWKDKVNRLFEK